MTDEPIGTSSHLCLAEWVSGLYSVGTTQCQSGKNAAVVARINSDGSVWTL